MKRSLLPTFLLAAGLSLLGAVTGLAQPVDPYPALSRGAVDFAAMSAADEADTNDLYLTEVIDYGGIQYGFTLDKGESAAWGYTFYSPARDSNYIVLVSSQANVVFGILYAGSAPSPDAEAPEALDTSGAYAQSAKFAEALRNDPGFQAFVNAHPEAANVRVQLRMLTDDEAYTPPAGFPTTGAVWIAFSDIFGDSVHICMLAATSGTMACDDYFSRSIPYAIGISQLSSVRFGTSNFGMFGGDYTQGQPVASFEAPDGSGNTYIYGAGLWFGARKRVGDSVLPRVFITYDPNSGESWATPGEGYVDRTTYSQPVLANAASHDPTTGAPVLEGGFNWPLWVVAPDTDPTMMDPGTFIGLQSDRVAGGSTLRPAYVANVDDQYVARYHDEDLARYSSSESGFPLGLQIQENIFAQPGGFDHTVILSYEIVNRSSDTLFDAVAGLVTDFDIGAMSGNDRSRFYSQRPDLRSAIAWTGAESGVQTPFGLLVMTLLEAPMTVEGGVIDEAARNAYRTQGEAGTYQTWTLETDPSGSAARYAFLTSGEKDADTRAGDLRGALASETFTMLPGDTAHFAVAYIVNRGRDAITGADPALEDRITNVINAYYGLQFSGVRSRHGAEGALALAAAPNPARGQVTLRVDLASAGDASFEIVDQLGEGVMSGALGHLDAGRSYRSLDVAGLASGAYVVVLRTDAGLVSVPLVIAR